MRYDFTNYEFWPLFDFANAAPDQLIAARPSTPNGVDRVYRITEVWLTPGADGGGRVSVCMHWCDDAKGRTIPRPRTISYHSIKANRYRQLGSRDLDDVPPPVAPEPTNVEQLELIVATGARDRSGMTTHQLLTEIAENTARTAAVLERMAQRESLRLASGKHQRRGDLVVVG